MQMPKPSPEHDRLAAFTGDWAGEETLHPAPWRPQGSTAHGHFHMRMEMSGFFLVSTYEERQGEAVVYSGRGVYGYEPAAKAYTMYWFDNMGGSYPHAVKGVFEDDALRFEAPTPQGRARFSYALHGADEFSFRIDTSANGAPDATAWTPFMEGRYRRVAKKG